MATTAVINRSFGAPSKVFANTPVNAVNDELGAGVASSYGVIGYKGKVWSIKYQGTETPLMRDDGDGARGSIEVVLIKSATAISKIYYENGYVDGSNAAPDCWSSDGVKPDAGAQKKQCASCAQCPMNAWGSRTTDAGKQGKACSDSRRLAVVPVSDIANEVMGGPMLLRVPAASLKDLKSFGETLNSYGHHYYAVATRIAFDPAEAYPKFVFSAIRPLSDAEALTVVNLRDDADGKLARLLNTSAELAPETPARPASPFEQDQPAEPAKAATAAPRAAATTKPAATKPAAPAPVAPVMEAAAEEEEEAEYTEEEEEAPADDATKSFDDVLDGLL